MDKQVRIGFDRFIKLEWADFALDLIIKSEDESQNYQALKEYLGKEISGKESARKTANQLRSLWLNETDACQELRNLAINHLAEHYTPETSVYHFGMAINVFPIFLETCRKIGVLNKVQGYLPKEVLISRIGESFGNPSSIPRIVNRVIQTLKNWGFLEEMDKKLHLKEIQLEDPFAMSWIVLSLIRAGNMEGLPIEDLKELPIKLGVNFLDLRGAIRQCQFLELQRDRLRSAIVKGRDILSYSNQ